MAFGKNLFKKLNEVVDDVVGGVENTISEFTGTSTSDFPQEATLENSLNRVFTAKFGIGSKKFVFKENSFVHGETEYPYSELKTFEIVNIPDSKLQNGVATTQTKTGVRIQIAFEYESKAFVLIAINYANNQIDLQNNRQKDYKYCILSNNGSKLEVYEDYIIAYTFKTGRTNIMGNSMAGSGIIKTIVNFFDLISFQINTSDTGENILKFLGNNSEEILISVTAQHARDAQDIISYIEKRKQEIETEQNSENNCFNNTSKLIAEERELPLCNSFLHITKEKDLYNSYRKEFNKFSKHYTDKAKKEYIKKVRDLDTFITFSSQIYSNNLLPLIQHAVDILVAEDIWSVTPESFYENHISKYHLFLDDYQATCKSIELSIEANKKATSAIMGLVPNLTGGGFGIKGAMKGIATATAFNIARDGIEANIIESANISVTQKEELFQRINTDNLFERIFNDYWNIYNTLADELIKNGKHIWILNNEAIKQADNIFQNITRPTFPENKLLGVMIDVINLNPYNSEYHKFLKLKFGDTDEVNAIKEYFGY